MKNVNYALNNIIFGDCLTALAQLAAGSVQLVYLDPPFNTNLTQRTRTASYADSFGSTQNYISYMRPRVQALRRVLAANGSLFFHCDWRTSHHVRVMLDEIFSGDDALFVNEIIWHYGLGASRTRKQLLTKHDVIFWYANGKDYAFNLIRQEPTPAMLNKYCHTEEAGKRYMLSYGKKYYLKGGKPLDDVWTIPAIAPTSRERVGYPTQKPLALLRRIVQLASNPGDTVLDPFCGSGTTLVAAQELGRNWVGMDQNEQAIRAAQQRLSANA